MNKNKAKTLFKTCSIMDNDNLWKIMRVMIRMNKKRKLSRI